MNSPALAPYAAEVLSVVCETASLVLEANRARLNVEETNRGPVFRLQPSNPDAAEVEVQVDSPEQITVYLGRHENALEACSRDRSQLLHELREVVAAAVVGGYSEDVSPDHKKILGRLVLGDRVMEISLNMLFTKWGQRRGWSHIEYAPYV